VAIPRKTHTRACLQSIYDGRACALDEAEREIVASLSRQPRCSTFQQRRAALAARPGRARTWRYVTCPRIVYRELPQEQSGHLYARECAAKTWYAIGTARWRQAEVDGAHAGFHECLRRVPTDPLACAALGKAESSAHHHSRVDSAIAGAVRCVGEVDDGNCELDVVKIERVLIQAATGDAGWLLPVEPMLNIPSEPWLSVLALLRRRAA
jgi:hypothetical protein